jgi:hypothetical protein
MSPAVSHRSPGPWRLCYTRCYIRMACLLHTLLHQRGRRSSSDVASQADDASSNRLDCDASLAFQRTELPGGIQAQRSAAAELGRVLGMIKRSEPIWRLLVAVHPYHPADA